MMGLILGYFIACALFVIGLIVDRWKEFNRTFSSWEKASAFIYLVVLLPYWLFDAQRRHARG